MKLSYLIGLVACALRLGEVQAACVRVSYTRLPSPNDPAYVDPAYGRFGTWSGASNGQGGSGLPAVINIDDGTFQPTGSLLGVGVSTLAQLARPALHPEQVLYRCTPDEAGKLYEFFATNAIRDDTGGKEEGATAGLPGAYRSVVADLLLRITHLNSGHYLTSRWQRHPLQPDVDGAGYLLVKARHFSALQVEALRAEYLPGRRATGPWPVAAPAGFLAFQGGGISPGLQVGDDSGSNRSGWYQSWPGAVNMYGQVSLRRSATCSVSTQGQPLLFSSLGLAALAQGASRSVTLEVQLDCRSGVLASKDTAEMVSGVGAGETALGFLPAVTLSVPGVDSTRFLLSDGYGSDPDIATGVGIRLEDALGHPLTLLSSAAVGGAGWYPALEQGAPVYADSGIRRYRRSFTATLQALPGQTPRPGRVRTRAFVLVKVQ
ncbi:fimbrial protein [Silvimonas sp. JCM 19000]